eukprot:scaffold248216_cov17-Tisochrysis_lutea.AAC.1
MFYPQVRDLGSLSSKLAGALACTGTPPAPLAAGSLLRPLQQVGALWLAVRRLDWRHLIAASRCCVASSQASSQGS